jgi:outer membrane murein-binding lipoprotein Lpp
MFTKYLKSSLLVAAVSSSALLVGCATQAKVDAFTAAQEKAGIVYAQVNKISSASANYHGACESKDQRLPDEYKKLYCHRLNDFKSVELGIVSDGTVFVRNEFISNKVPLEAGAIVKLDLRRPKGDYFAGVESAQETPGCYWSGNPNDRLDSSAKSTAKFAGGFLIGALAPIPTVLGFNLSRNITGGVECHGWSYKETFHDFLHGRSGQPSVSTPLAKATEWKQGIEVKWPEKTTK